MKRIICGCAVVLVLLAAARGGEEKPDTEKVKGAIVGTWEMATPELPEGFRDLKHITPTHFIWVIYRKNEMDPVASAGGTWSVVGDQYTERCDFATPGHEHLRGKEMTFTVKIEGDKLVQKGVLDTGAKVDEIWKRAARARDGKKP